MQKYAEAGSNANKPGTSVHCTARICMRAKSSACTREGGWCKKMKRCRKIRRCIKIKTARSQNPGPFL